MAYAEHLHALGTLLVAAEVGDGGSFTRASHYRGPPVLREPTGPAHQVRRGPERAAAPSAPSETMPYTGLLILGFIAVHLATFSHHLVDQASRNIF